MLMLQKTKVMDEMYLKYSVKLVDLQHAIAKYDLDEDEEIRQIN